MNARSLFELCSNPSFCVDCIVWVSTRRYFENFLPTSLWVFVSHRSFDKLCRDTAVENIAPLRPPPHRLVNHSEWFSPPPVLGRFENPQISVSCWTTWETCRPWRWTQHVSEGQMPVLRSDTFSVRIFVTLMYTLFINRRYGGFLLSLELFATGRAKARAVARESIKCFTCKEILRSMQPFTAR